MREETRSHAKLAMLAERQHGVVAHQQLRQLGFSESAIGRQCESRRLHRLQRGVYALGHPLVSEQGRCMAAVLACGEGAVLSHRSAAWLWGISTQLPRVAEVTAPVPRRNRPERLRLHSARPLHPGDRAISDGIPVTAVPRTLLDLAGSDPRSLRWSLPRAKRLGLLDLIEVDAMLCRSRGRRGVRRLRLGLERYRQPVFTRSDVEIAFFELVRGAGLPTPSMNQFVAGFELDAYWPELRYAVELDTYDYHGDEISFEEDRLRQEELKLAGIEMTRITGKRLDREPAGVASRLSRLLDQRRRDLSRGV